jgi:hypothetical protein
LISGKILISSPEAVELTRGNSRSVRATALIRNRCQYLILLKFFEDLFSQGEKFLHIDIVKEIDVRGTKF